MRVTLFDRILMTTMLRALPCVACVCATIFGAAPAGAQTTAAYPVRPVRIVVPFAPGGATDILARAIGQKLTEALGQPVIVDNRAGAGGNIGTDVVAKA